MEKQFLWSNEEWRDPCSSLLQQLLLPDPTNGGLFFVNNNTNQGDPFVESGFPPYKPNSPILPHDHTMNPNPNVNITKLQGKTRAAAADAGEGSSLSEQMIIGKKRKKETEEEESKDYIHVRARRGQATDSHSLAERVRREKIGERMKFLQDLVPGCNKVTGKAVRLDEIINYVQSLQRQVEFLSMKMATVNPRSMEFNNIKSLLLCKDNVSEGSTAGGQQEHQGFPNYNQTDQHHHFGASNLIIRHNQDVQMELWNDDLQSVVQMGTLGLTQQPRH